VPRSINTVTLVASTFSWPQSEWVSPSPEGTRAAIIQFFSDFCGEHDRVSRYTESVLILMMKIEGLRAL